LQEWRKEGIDEHSIGIQVGGSMFDIESSAFGWELELLGGIRGREEIRRQNRHKAERGSEKGNDEEMRETIRYISAIVHQVEIVRRFEKGEACAEIAQRSCHIRHSREDLEPCEASADGLAVLHGPENICHDDIHGMQRRLDERLIDFIQESLFFRVAFIGDADSFLFR